MDRFLYIFSEKPIISTLFIMGVFSLMAFAIVGAAQHGQASFMARAEQTFAAGAADDDNNSLEGRRSDRGRSRAVAATDNNESETRSAREAANAESLVIRSVSMVQPAFTCGESSTTVKMNGMRLSTNEAHKGGTYTWKVDILSGLDYSMREQWRGSIPAGEADYQVSYESTDTGSLYSRSFTHPHDEIKLRIRIVRPNDVTSAWLIVPASDECQSL